MTRANAEGPFRVDLESFPLVRLSSPNVAQFDHPSAESFFQCIDRGLERNLPFVILHDARGVPNADETRRREFMRHLEVRRTRIEKLVVAYAAICGSPLERGLVTAFMWFIRVPLPIRIFGNEVEAKAWLLSRHLEVSGPAREQQTGSTLQDGEPSSRDSGIYNSRRSSAS